MLKHIMKKMVRAIVQNETAWRMLDKSILPFARYADWMRSKSLGTLAESSPVVPAGELLSTEHVLHGPFKGMIYNNDLFCCSSIPPKLLGSYERELHSWLDEIFEKQYDGIIDIGCAEGYYAVGFAWKMKEVNVYAYDINKEAREQCKRLAKVNHVEDWVELRTFCDPEELKRVVAGRRFLIISDCEGYEKTLFNHQNLSALSNSDILIEVHDFMDITMLPYLRKLFSATHKICERESIDDLRKLDLYDYPELKGRDIHDRYKMLAEWRKRIMIWMYMTPFEAD